MKNSPGKVFAGELEQGAAAFLVKLATCENIATGKVIEWPPAPLTGLAAGKDAPDKVGFGGCVSLSFDLGGKKDHDPPKEQTGP